MNRSVSGLLSLRFWTTSSVASFRRKFATSAGLAEGCAPAPPPASPPPDGVDVEDRRPGAVVVDQVDEDIAAGRARAEHEP